MSVVVPALWGYLYFSCGTNIKKVIGFSVNGPENGVKFVVTEGLKCDVDDGDVDDELVPFICYTHSILHGMTWNFA